MHDSNAGLVVQEWSYLRGGLSTLDRDYGIFNKIHHDIGTHVVHHLLPQIPHYNLPAATEACKPVMGPYYREPEPCKGLFPFHLIEPLKRSIAQDHYVSDTGDIVYYQQDPKVLTPPPPSAHALPSDPAVPCALFFIAAIFGGLMLLWIYAPMCCAHLVVP